MARWQFRAHPEVQVVCGRFEDLPSFDCVVTAGNSFGLMDAGMDLAVLRFFGRHVMERIQQRILEDHLGDPHHEFPLRNGIEKSFKVVTSQGEYRGELNFSQALREAYPGAVYYYMAMPYRVQRLNYRDGEITVARERRYTTKPLRLAMAFPDLGLGVLRLQQCAAGFLAEAEMQVSERVTGFKEKRGKNETVHNYGAGSSFSQQPLNRFIRTTGVCWYFPQTSLVSDAIANRILEAFCAEHGVQPRDLGVGRFHAQNPPGFSTPVNGICIFDNSNGSLRLTERLAANFPAVVSAALAAESARGNADLTDPLSDLLAQLHQTVNVTGSDLTGGVLIDQASTSGECWRRVIAPGSKAILTSTSGTQEVTVLGHVYTPLGLQYQLQHPATTVRWMIAADALELINGVTVTMLYNIQTGELPFRFSTHAMSSSVRTADCHSQVFVNAGVRWHRTWFPISEQRQPLHSVNQLRSRSCEN